METIDIIGTLKGVQLKSKEDDGRVIHNLQLSIQITDGAERVQDIVSSIKQLVKLSINNVQPKLVPSEPNSYKS